MDRFTERFCEVTESLSDAELAVTMGMTVGGVRTIRDGSVKSIKLEAALRLCAEMGISPYYLGGWDSPKKMTPPPQPEAPKKPLGGLRDASAASAEHSPASLDGIAKTLKSLAASVAAIRTENRKTDSRLQTLEGSSTAQKRR